METFGQAVRRMREQQGYSLREFAREVNFAYTYVGQVERGEKAGSNAFAAHADRVLNAGGRLVELYTRDDALRRGWRQPGPWQCQPATFPQSVADWLISYRDAGPGRTGGRAVAATDVTVLRDACRSFQEMDRRLGGAVVRTSLVHFLDHVVMPTLDGSYDDTTGRQLLAIAARLSDIAGYAAFDMHDHAGARRLFVQALRLARAAADESLGAHILGDMTRQACYVGDLAEAVALARAGQRSAARTGCARALARCVSLEALALAGQQDHTGADQAMVRAEAAMAGAGDEAEAPWIRYFSPDQLRAEFAHAAELMGRARMVPEFARPALQARQPLERRNLLLLAAVARAHAAEGDLDGAVRLGLQALQLARAVASARGVAAVAALRAALADHGDQPVVAAFEAAATGILGASRLVAMGSPGHG